jgi:hypothetical protein
MHSAGKGSYYCRAAGPTKPLLTSAEVAQLQLCKL